jgi:hypothetical protein
MPLRVSVPAAARFLRAIGASAPLKGKQMPTGADLPRRLAAMASHGARLALLTWLQILAVFAAVDAQHLSTIAFLTVAT